LPSAWIILAPTEVKGHRLNRRRGSLRLLGLSAIAAGTALAGCGTSAAKPVNTSLATNACHSFLLVTTNSPGLLGGGGLPKDQTWSQVLGSASADAKASRDSNLYRSIQSASPFIVGSYDPGAVSRSQLIHAENQMDHVGYLCGAYGVGFPLVGYGN
jgi:hypothetical protein